MTRTPFNDEVIRLTKKANDSMKIDKRSGEDERDESLEARLSSLEEQLAAKDEEIAALRDSLSRAESEREEYLEMLKRVQAESENFRKRMVREQTQVVEFATQNMICELLPLVDNLERAIEAAGGVKDIEQLKEGVHMIYEQLKSILAQTGLEAIEPKEEPFDPQLHEAVLQVESDEHEENTVIDVVQKGYCLKGRVIRPAMVKVTRKSGRS